MGKASFLMQLSALVSTLLLTACGNLWGSSGSVQVPAASPNNPNVTSTPTPFQPEEGVPSATATPVPVPSQATDTPIPAFLWISPAVPDTLRQFAISSGMALASSPETATTHLEVVKSQAAAEAAQTADWIYAVVTAFPTTIDGSFHGRHPKYLGRNPFRTLCRAIHVDG